VGLVGLVGLVILALRLGKTALARVELAEEVEVEDRSRLTWGVDGTGDGEMEVMAKPFFFESE